MSHRCQRGHRAKPIVALIMSAACISFASSYLSVISGLLKALWASLAVVLSPLELNLKQHLEQMLHCSDRGQQTEHANVTLAQK